MKSSSVSQRYDQLRVGLVVALLTIIWPVRARAQITAGDTFPDLIQASASAIALPQTAGRVVLVDFWASWCGPCKLSFPALARLHADFAGKGLVVIGVSVDEKEAAFASFLKKMKPPFAVIRDEEQKLVRVVKVPTMPTSYLVGRDGRVRLVHRGFHGAQSEAELRQTIETLLAEKT